MKREIKWIHQISRLTINHTNQDVCLLLYQDHRRWNDNLKVEIDPQDYAQVIFEKYTNATEF